MPTELKPLPDNCLPIRTEMETLYHELPRLLSEGHEGKFVLISGHEVAGVWATFEAALEAGYEKYGPDAQFIAQPVDHRDLVRLAPYFGPLGRVTA